MKVFLTLAVLAAVSGASARAESNALVCSNATVSTSHGDVRISQAYIRKGNDPQFFEVDVVLLAGAPSARVVCSSLVATCRGNPSLECLQKAREEYYRQHDN